jgi:ABC-type polysaccharide/polyol phosphate export permease
VLEASGVLIAGGNLIKKVLFPAEVLPVVTVLTNLVQFLLGLPILLAFLWLYGKLGPTALLLPLPLLVQLVFTLASSLLVSASPVHFATSPASLLTCCTFGSSPLRCSTSTRTPLPACTRCSAATR